jgi:hypothetical protein
MESAGRHHAAGFDIPHIHAAQSFALPVIEHLGKIHNAIGEGILILGPDSVPIEKQHHGDSGHQDYQQNFNDHLGRKAVVGDNRNQKVDHENGIDPGKDHDDIRQHIDQGFARSITPRNDLFLKMIVHLFSFLPEKQRHQGADDSAKKCFSWSVPHQLF